MLEGGAAQNEFVLVLEAHPLATAARCAEITAAQKYAEHYASRSNLRAESTVP